MFGVFETFKGFCKLPKKQTTNKQKAIISQKYYARSLSCAVMYLKVLIHEKLQTCCCGVVVNPFSLLTTKRLLEFYLVKYLHVYFFLSRWLNNSFGFENGTNVGVPLNVTCASIAYYSRPVGVRVHCGYCGCSRSCH